MKKTKAQVTIYFIVVIAIIIIITMIVVNIGKIARDKTHADNSADAGALAGASVSAYAFNYVAEANKNKQKRLEGNYNDFSQAMDKYHAKIEQHHQLIQSQMQVAKNHTCCVICPAEVITEQVMREIGETKYEVGTFRNQIYQLIKGAMESDQANGKDDQKGQELGVIPNYWKLQEDLFIAMRERVQDDGSMGGGNDLYSDALTACYKYNLYNCGFPVKMGEDSKEFYEWVDSLQPTNCTPETYNWTDGAGRNHTVTATCCIDDWLTWEVNHTKDNRQKVKSDLDQAENYAMQAYNYAKTAESHYSAACAVEGCCLAGDLSCLTKCSTEDAAGDTAIEQAMKALQDSMNKITDAYKGTKRTNGSKTVKTKDGTKDFIIVDLDDITHSRTLTSNNFQFHMGGVVKGGQGDIDTPTFYPPIQSSATASFAGQAGNDGIRSKNPAHDASLQ